MTALPVIAVANGGNNTPRSSLSTAPTTTWSAGGNMPVFNSGSGGAWTKPAYSPSLGMYVAGNNSGDFSGNLTALAYSSNNGVTWNSVTQANIDGGTVGWLVEDICWSNTLNLFVAVCSGGPTTTKRVLTSANGTSWTGQVLPDASKTLMGVAWSKELGLLVAVGSSNAIYHSANGSTWTLASGLPGTSKNWIKIAWGGDGAGAGVQKFVAIAIGAGGSNDECYSADGSSWTQQTVGPGSGYSWVDIGYSTDQDRFVVVGGVLNYTTAGSVTAWTQVSTANPFQGICWSHDLSTWVGVSASTTVLTSANGTTWVTNTNEQASQNWNKIVAGLTTTVTETADIAQVLLGIAQALDAISGPYASIAQTLPGFITDISGADEFIVIAQTLLGPIHAMDVTSGEYGTIGQTFFPLSHQLAGEQLADPGNPAFYSWWFLGA